MGSAQPRPDSHLDSAASVQSLKIHDSGKRRTGCTHSGSCTRMNITLHGELGTPEYSAAQYIAEILQPNVAHIDGEISVRAGIKLFGQRRRDVDILVMGRCPAGIPAEIWDASLPKSKLHISERRPAAFFSFVFCIEVKDQCASDVRFENTSAWVRYREKWSDAGAQSEQQK